jgi:hypothetical protein
MGLSTVTYQDVDGDLVVVQASKPIFTSANKNTVFKFDAGNVNQSNATKQQLWTVNLAVLGAAAEGVGLSVTATRTASGGDGRVNVGFMNAAGVDLGQVAVGGDLGRIEAGTLSDLVPAVAGLTVRSMGRYGLDTQNPVGASLLTFVQGRVDKFIVRSDVVGAQIKVTSATPVAIGSVQIGGSLRAEGAMPFNGSIRVTGGIGSIAIRGDVEGSDGNNTGHIQATGNLGPVTIGGSLVGHDGDISGTVLGGANVGPVTINGAIRGGNGMKSGYVYAGDHLTGLTVRGSILGGYGERAGCVESQGDMGAALVFGSVIGESLAGAGNYSGTIYCSGKLEGKLGGAPVGFRVGGSLVGGNGDYSGSVLGTDGIGPARIGGDVLGGHSNGPSGEVGTGGRLASLSVKGSVEAGLGTYTGRIQGNQGIGSVSIGGDLRGGGNGTNSATVETQGGIGSVTIGGSILSSGTTYSGAILAKGVIGKILVKGSLVGTDMAPVRIVMGRDHPAGSNLVLGSLTVLGQVVHADVLAGYDGVNGYNADAQIGTVTVGGDWVASNLVAGAVDGGNGFGNSLDAKIGGANTTDAVTAKSKIGSIMIGGQLLGTTAAGDHFGFVAEEVAALKVGGVTYTPKAGTGNDLIVLGPTGDVNLREI